MAQRMVRTGIQVLREVRMIDWPENILPKNKKYSQWYELLILKSKKRSETLEYKENHHVIPRSFGGTDDLDNRVDLTPREHYIAHALLWKMDFPSPYREKMVWAFDFMCQRKITKINSRLYESARIEKANVRKGKTYEELYTPEQIERMHKARRERVITPEGLERMKAGRAKASRAPMPEHVKKQMSKRFTGIKRPTIKCTVCGFEGVVSNINRWHNENCDPKRNMQNMKRRQRLNT